jgi:tetratricopeptide (TPR) repeat protein
MSMSLPTRFLATLTTAGLLLAGTAKADEIVLKSGERREGRVEDIVGTPGSIAFTSSVGQLQIRRDLIAEIIEHDDATDYTILGNQFLKNRSYETARRMFERALEADPAHEPAKEGLRQTMALVSELEAEQQRSLQSENSQLITRAGELILEEKFEEAERLLDRVESSSPSDEQIAAARLVRRDLYLAWGKDREDRLDAVGAETYFTKVLELDPGNLEAREELLVLWEKDSSKRQEVLTVYEERLAASPEDLTLNRKVADLLSALNRHEESIPMLKVLVASNRFPGLGYERKLSTALETKAMSLAGSGDLDGAIATYEELISLFPNTDPSPLAYLAYEKRLQALAPDDWTGRAALLADLQRQGLNTLALQEAELILRNDPENATALAFLRAEAVMRLAEIQGYFNEGQFLTSRDLSREFAQSNLRFADLVKQAEDLYTRSNIEAERQARRVREQGREIATRGDEYLADARRYAELMKNQETSDRTTVLSYKQEATKFAKRAIDTYTVALRLDPSLGPITGMDLTNKLNDARVLHNALTAPPLRTTTGGPQRPRV